ncbi:MAG: hypothetical protein ACFCUQ_20130 [Kiloniellales bacterium]
MIFSSGLPQKTGSSPWCVPQAGKRWPGRVSLLFVVAASLVCWGLLIGQAVLIL